MTRRPPISAASVLLGLLLTTVLTLPPGPGARLLPLATASAAAPAPSPPRALQSALASGMRRAGGASGALVVDLTTGQTLYALHKGVERMPASVEKLYTTSTALARFGAGATLTTQILGTGSLSPYGVWRGTLYLRGGGDPTFGTSDLIRSMYGGQGAAVGRLAANLQAETGMTGLEGRIVGDETLFDSMRGIPAYGYAFDHEEEGSLSALAFNRDVDPTWSVPVANPPLYAAQGLAEALRAQGFAVTAKQAGAGRTPRSARLLSQVHSPRMAKLIALTNAPSDNYLAETLLKDLGARFGGAGSTAAGAAVVRAQLARWNIHPRLEDGSGLSRRDRTSPDQVVSLLTRESSSSAFVASLAVAGRTGTLGDRMRGTGAQDRCRGKTGTLHDASNLAGLCTARDGHTLAFAILMNAVDPYGAHPIQDGMVEAIAGYDG